MKVGVVLHVKSIVELSAPRSLESEAELQMCYMDHGQCTHKTKIVVYKNQMHTGLFLAAFLFHSHETCPKHHHGLQFFHFWLPSYNHSGHCMGFLNASKQQRNAIGTNTNSNFS